MDASHGDNSSSDGTIMFGSTAPASKDVNPFRNFNTWVNHFLFPESFATFLLDRLGPDGAHYCLCYLRNFLSGMIIYYVTAGTFHYMNYVLDKEGIFKSGKRRRPSGETIRNQIWLAQRSMFLYVALPVFSDYLIEEGYTFCYYSFDEIGGFVNYLILTFVYFTLVEIGIYWMHRTLHTNKWLYRNIHARHHDYNKPETLTPWAR